MLPSERHLCRPVSTVRVRAMARCSEKHDDARFSKLAGMEHVVGACDDGARAPWCKHVTRRTDVECAGQYLEASWAAGGDGLTATPGTGREATRRRLL